MTFSEFRRLVIAEFARRGEALDWVALEDEDFNSLLAEMSVMDKLYRSDPDEPRGIMYASSEYAELGVQSVMVMGIVVTRKAGVTPMNTT